MGSERVKGSRKLADERAATVARIETMTADLEAIVAATRGANIDDEHDPEGSTIAFERAQVAGLLAQGRTTLAGLDRALARLADGSYWVCERCGARITSERLAAIPAGPRTCMHCAAHERGRLEYSRPLRSRSSL